MFSLLVDMPPHLSFPPRKTSSSLWSWLSSPRVRTSLLQAPPSPHSHHRFLTPSVILFQPPSESQPTLSWVFSQGHWYLVKDSRCTAPDIHRAQSCLGVAESRNTSLLMETLEGCPQQMLGRGPLNSNAPIFRSGALSRLCKLGSTG